MTSFYNLDEAFSYRRHCPCKNCGHGLFPETATIKYVDRGRHVEFALGDGTLTVDIHSNAIISYDFKRQNQTVYGVNQPSITFAGSVPGRLRSILGQGTDIFPVTVSCNNCKGYNYVLQVHVNVGQGCLVGLVLNSETISVDDYVKFYTVRTIYTTGKTEMVIRHQHLSSFHEPERIEYPMVSLNVEEPMKTVERLKKLTVFL